MQTAEEANSAQLQDKIEKTLSLDPQKLYTLEDPKGDIPTAEEKAGRTQVSLNSDLEESKQLQSNASIDASPKKAATRIIGKLHLISILFFLREDQSLDFYFYVLLLKFSFN